MCKKNAPSENYQHQLYLNLQNTRIQQSATHLQNCASDIGQRWFVNLSFISNAACVGDSTPTIANLVLGQRRICDQCPLCHQRQTLLHVLNNCSVLGYLAFEVIIPICWCNRICQWLSSLHCSGLFWTAALRTQFHPIVPMTPTKFLIDPSRRHMVWKNSFFASVVYISG